VTRDKERAMTGWRKSSFSSGNTDCVQVAWRKSSFSGGNTNCVEVATAGERVGIRDSKNSRIEVSVSGVAWRAFLISLD
jgi:hypothetical protein